LQGYLSLNKKTADGFRQPFFAKSGNLFYNPLPNPPGGDHDAAGFAFILHFPLMAESSIFSFI